MVLGPAYRGHAPVTFDTVTSQAIVDEVNAHTANSGIHGGGGYIASTYADVFMSVGSGDPMQTVFNATWTTLNLSRENADYGNCFNTSTHYYTVPATGVYFCQALIRPNDGQVSKASFPDGSGVGIGIGTSNVDFPGFQWNKWMWMSGVGGGRLSWDYTRICVATVGDPMRLYMFSDLGGQFDIYSATMQIYRLG